MTKKELNQGLTDLINTNRERIKAYRKIIEEIKQMATSQKEMLTKSYEKIYAIRDKHADE